MNNYSKMSLARRDVIYFLVFAVCWNVVVECGGRRQILEYERRTMVEDVVGAYELRTLQSMIKNSTSKLSNDINKLTVKFTNSLEKDEWENSVESKLLVVQETVDSLKSTVEGTKGFLEELYDGIKKNLQSFNTQFAQNLSQLKLFIEHQSRQFQSVFTKTSVATHQIIASDCSDLYNLSYNASGTYWLNKYGLRVLCDMETDGGGWLVIQRRAKVDKQVDFSQDWFTYKIGFGDLDTEFWIGNDVLHMLTNQKTYELRIEMEDFENGTFYASYSNFRVGSEKSFYALDIGNYSGNASDAFTYHHGRPFSTKDKDLDNYVNGSCASFFSGGWWYDRCYDAHLNGIYPDPPDRRNASFISWWTKNEDMKKYPLVLTNVVIKIRPRID